MTARLFERMARHKTLRAAWEHVRRNDMADGVAAPSVERFAEDPKERIAQLAGRLRSGSFQPGPLAPVKIPKDGGESRTLLVAAADDRVVERALAQVLSPHIDPVLSPASFAYRAGLGVGHAVRRLVDLREEGLGWVVRTDINDCFDSIPPRRVLRVLNHHVADARVIDLVAAFLSQDRRPRKHRTGLGIPQGGSLSPLLSNLYLDGFDVRLMVRGFPVVRYADDIAIAASSEKEAHVALREAGRAAQALDLELGAEDTQVVSYREGFAFLGEDFNVKYPPARTSDYQDPPDRRTLYVAVPGSYVWMSRGRVVVKRRQAELLSVPAGRVARVVAAGSVTIAPGVRSWALRSGVDVIFLSRSGSFQGYLAGANHSAVERRRRQFAATADDKVCVLMARGFVRGKLAHQRTLLMRFNRPASAEPVGESIDEIGRYLDMLPDAETVNEVSGLEGAAARSYYEAVGHLLPEGVEFRGRSRRPPLDAVNAAMSYGYAVLEGEATAALVSAGLDPTVGFLHGDERTRPSLSLDLMEEFRPLIVDHAVVEAFRRGSLSDADGRSEKGRVAVLLTENGKRALLAALEDRLLTPAVYLDTGRQSAYRRHIQLQAQQIASRIQRREWRYEPIVWRT